MEDSRLVTVALADAQGRRKHFTVSPAEWEEVRRGGLPVLEKIAQRELSSRRLKPDATIKLDDRGAEPGTLPWTRTGDADTNAKAPIQGFSDYPVEDDDDAGRGGTTGAAHGAGEPGTCDLLGIAPGLATPNDFAGHAARTSKSYRVKVRLWDGVRNEGANRTLPLPAEDLSSWAALADAVERLTGFTLNRPTGAYGVDGLPAAVVASLGLKAAGAGVSGRTVKLPNGTQVSMSMASTDPAEWEGDAAEFAEARRGAEMLADHLREEGERHRDDPAALARLADLARTVASCPANLATFARKKTAADRAGLDALLSQTALGRSVLRSR